MNDEYCGSEARCMIGYSWTHRALNRWLYNMIGLATSDTWRPKVTEGVGGLLWKSKSLRTSEMMGVFSMLSCVGPVSMMCVRSRKELIEQDALPIGTDGVQVSRIRDKVHRMRSILTNI